MNKNIKRMFFVTTLILLLVGLSAISAADVSNDTSSIAQQSVVKEVNVEKVSDNTITDTSTKNIKKEEQTTDLYVSDSSGSDDNSGTNTSPYKTIQKALDTTNADSTFNIHIAEGTYKGLGNTNLTVNGNYNINIIGTGVNSTVFDGEASYEIHKQTDAGDFYWESSEIWYPYENAVGNWFMNVTAGTGKISISNLTMQNGWVTGGTSIDSYPYAVMDNWGDLTIDNVYFYSNHGGVGSAIRNNHDATLTVTNSIFDNNTKSSSTGNDGIIYNNGTAYLDNIQMINNLARWGSILNDHVLYVNNSLIRNNTAYDGASTYKFGAGIASNSGTADYFNEYTIEGIETYVNNVTFTDIDQLSIYQSLGKLVVNNSHFNHTTGIVLGGLKNSTDYLVENNEFYNMTGSSYFASLSSTERKIFDIYAPNNCTLTITNNTIDNNNDDSTAIQIGTDKIITNNNIKNVIEVNGNNNQITNNTITTRTGYAITLTSSSRNNIITDNYLTTRTSSGDVAVQSRRQNTIENNTPLMSEYTVTDETYNEFFDENGKLYNTNVTPGSILYLSGDFYNKSFTFDNIGLKVTTKDQTTLYNTTITVTPTAVIQLDDMTIDNTNSKDNIINLEGNYNTINNLTIKSVSDYSLNAIKVSGNDTIITSTTITVTQNGEDTEETTGIFIESSNNQLDSINVNVKSESTNNITVVKIKSDKQISNNKLNNMTVNANGNITKAFEVTNADKTTIMMDTMYVAMTITGKDYVSFLEVTNSSEVIFEKTSWANYQLRSNGVGYAIILNGTADNPMKNITFTKNGGLNLNAVNSTYVYARNVNGFDFAFGQAGIGMYSGESITGFDLENVNNTIQQDSIGYGLSFSRGSVETKLFTLINSHHNTFNGINSNTITNGYGIYLYNSTNNTFNPSQTTSSWSPLRVATITTENTAIILENSDNNLFNYTNITSTNSNAIKLINSNNNQIINCVINANENGILLNQSNNNIITENTVKTPDDYSVELISSHDNTISYNNFQAVNTGDNSVENPEENIIYHNGPIFINLTDDNYDTYFMDGKLKDEYKSKNITVVLGSDLHEKELTFDFEEEFMKLHMTNPQNYTLYNTTFTLNTPYLIIFLSNYHDINGLNFYSNNEEETVVYTNTTYLNMNNINIYHENHEVNARTAIINAYYEYTLSDQHVMYWNIETHGPSQPTNDGQASTIAYQGYSLYYSNITVTETTNNNGIITATANVPLIQACNININGTNVVATENMQRSITRSNITAKAENLIGYKHNDSYLDPGRVQVQISYSNFYLEGNNVTGIIFENVTSNLVGNNLIGYNNITIKSNITIPIKVNITQDYADRFIKRINDNNINIESNFTQLADISGIWMNIFQNNYNLNTQTLEPLTMKDTNNNQVNQIYNNTITTTLDVSSLIKVENSSNIEVTENYLITSDKYGDVLVEADGENITVENNRPNIILTDENYNEYFTDSILNTQNMSNIMITIGSDINNKDMIFNQPVTIINNEKYTFNNMTITIEENATDTKLSNLTINNNDDRQSAIIIKANNTNISYNNINQNNTNNKQNLILINNATNIVFNYNNITANANESEIIKAEESSFYGFTYNNIISNGENIKALIITNTQTNIYNIIAQNNNITMASTNPTTAIYLKTNARIRYNNITIDANNNQTPIIEAINATLVAVQNNYIESHDLCGNDAVSGATTNSGNTPTNTGHKSNINITQDTINQYIPTKIEITTTDNFGQNITGTITATLNGEDVKVTNNYITITAENTDDITIQATYTDPTGKYNTTTITKTLTVTPTTLTVDPITATVGQTVNITARITVRDETLTDINKGKVTFKVNGKTLKDENGKVIYAKVVNGTATIENYEVPSDWSKDGTTIQAVYSGSTECEKLTSEKTNITIEKAAPTLTIDPIEPASIGSTIQLKATITDNNKEINTGKIVFKINGKTVKDENGKVIYAKVVNGTVSVDYVIPASMKAGNYTITATYIGTDYDKLTSESTISIIKA